MSEPAAYVLPAAGDISDTINLQVSLLELNYMLELRGYALYVTDRVVHQGEYPADYIIYWYWAQSPHQPESHKLFDLAAFVQYAHLPDTLSPLSAFMPDVPLTLHVPRALCDAETLAFIESEVGG